MSLVFPQWGQYSATVMLLCRCMGHTGRVLLYSFCMFAIKYLFNLSVVQYLRYIHIAFSTGFLLLSWRDTLKQLFQCISIQDILKRQT